MTNQNSNLIEFYGTECPYCDKIQPLIEKLEQDEGIKIHQLEVWHDDENMEEMMKYREDFLAACGELGVPSFINTKTRKVYCGNLDYDKLKAWALGE